MHVILRGPNKRSNLKSFLLHYEAKRCFSSKIRKISMIPKIWHYFSQLLDKNVYFYFSGICWNYRDHCHLLPLRYQHPRAGISKDHFINKLKICLSINWDLLAYTNFEGVMNQSLEWSRGKVSTKLIEVKIPNICKETSHPQSIFMNVDFHNKSHM